ncbi:hypothetical protein EJB05_25111, partial [Eragrostis curvula]
MTSEFATAPSTPEPPAAPWRDALEIMVERRLFQDEGGEGGMTIFRVPAHPEVASLADYVTAVRAVEQRARRCYSERTAIFDAAQGAGGDDQSADEFAWMLLLDGCFILQFFIKWHNREPDELCDVGWISALLVSDLLLLENQIPFFVLQALFSLRAPEAETIDLRRLILPHLRYHDFEETWRTEALTTEIHHLLHLFHASTVPSSLQWRQQRAVRCDMADPDTHRLPPRPLAVPSVTMLRDAGVQFKLKTSPRHLFDITFDKAKGVMSVPNIQIDLAYTAELVNLIAFEQTSGYRHMDASYPLSSYAALMGSLMKMGKDVEHLRKRGIMDNLLASDDDAASYFFQFLQQGGIRSLYDEQNLFAKMFADMNQYYKSRWHKHRTKFLRDYCSSPWAMIALVVAVFVFFFTVFKLSTGIYDLAHHSHSD